MNSSIPWRRISLVGLIAVVVVGVPLAYFGFFANNPGRTLTAGERSYQQGLVAIEQNRPEAAAHRFQEAVLQASKVLDDVAREKGSGKELKDAQLQRLFVYEGRAYWLKAQALRDLAFAVAKVEGQPIPEDPDLTEGGTFQAIMRIPDNETRSEAVSCMRQAAYRMTGLAEVQHEALRTEVMINPVDWTLIERFARQLLELEEDDTRALHQLALFHYEQPVIDARGAQTGVLPIEKRSSKRMLKAREFVERLKKSSHVRYWRAAELDARITQWLRDHGGSSRKPAELRAEEKRLQDLLGEALTKAKDDKNLTDLSVFDIEAVLSLHRLALAGAARSADRPSSLPKVEQLLDRNLELARRFAASQPVNPLTLEKCALAAVQSLTVARKPLKDLPAAKWQPRLQAALDLAGRARDSKVSNPELYADLVRLLDLEAYLAGKRGEQKRSEQLEKQADQWLKDGLALGEKAGLPPQRLADLHALAARKSLKGASQKGVTPHLDVLRKIPTRQARALVAFLEGVLSERQGRLERARQSLEKAESLGMETAQTDPVLVGLYLSLNRPADALTRLRRLVKGTAEREQLPERDRAWAEEFARSKEDLLSLQVVANLETAKGDAQRFVVQNPQQPIPGSLVAGYEKEARRLIGLLPEDSPQNRQARVALIRYLIQLNRTDEADKELTEARQYAADSVELLQLQIALLERSAARQNKPLDDAKRKQIDTLIQEYIAKYPKNVAARLLWATWLTQTRRADEAVAYLQDPANIPGDQDDRYRRLLALALVNKGDRAAGEEVLRKLPATPQVDLALIQMAATREEKSKQLSQAMKRHEGSGLLGCMEGLLALEAEKWKEATQSFFRALEYTQVRSTAEAGLQKALFAQVQKNPAAAREEVNRLIAQAPAEKVLFLAYAYASLLLDDLGTPYQDWSRDRNMATALNSWVQLYARETGNFVAAALTRAEFWGLAGRGDLAWAEVNRIVRDRPRDKGALRAGVNLALQSTDPVERAQGRKMVETLGELLPDSVEPMLLAAQFQLKNKDYSQARETLGAVLNKEPANQTALGLLADALVGLKDNTALGDLASRWVQQSPDSLAARGLQIQYLATVGQADQAVQVLHQSVSDQAKRWQEQGDKQRPPAGTTAEKWKEQAQAEIHRRRTTLEIELSKFLVRSSTPGAEAKARAILEKYPANPLALLMRGDLAMQHKDWKAARPLYEAVLKQSPRNFLAGNNLAWILAEKLDEVEQAAQLADRLSKGEHSGKPLAGDRLQPDFLDTLGVVYLKAGKPASYQRVRELFESARKRYPADPRLCLALGEAYAGLEEPKQARAMFRDAVKLATPDNAFNLTAEVRKSVIDRARAAEKKLATPRP